MVFLDQGWPMFFCAGVDPEEEVTVLADEMMKFQNLSEDQNTVLPLPKFTIKSGDGVKSL